MPLLSQFFQMLVLEIFGHRHVLLVEPVVARLVSADEQDRCSPGVEGVEDPDGPDAALRTSFPRLIAGAVML